MQTTFVLTVSLLLLVNSLLLVSAFSTVYDDAYARTLVKINGAVFADDPASCVKNIKEFADDWTVVAQDEKGMYHVFLCSCICLF
jgi:hypothetical protein